MKTLDRFSSRDKSISINPGRNETQRLDLTRIPVLRALIESRWPQFLARASALAVFIFIILAGLLGTPVGSHNFAIIFVWVAWWTGLKLIFIPVGGRSWCSLCPLPMPGEWLQRGGLITRTSQPLGLGRRWPKRLRGYWLQTGSFLLIGLFSAVTLTSARVTAWVLLALILLAAALSLVFERRAFCSYVCPIGGITGIYAQTAPVELRVINNRVCASHRDKTCYHECPWGVYPLALRDNSACGLCMECLRVCPEDNLALNIRPFGGDLGDRRRTLRLDEAFLALVMLGSALVFSAVFTGPWGALKMAAFQVGSTAWLVYAAGFLALNLLLLPGLFILVVQVGRKLAHIREPLRRSIANMTQALLPLGLFTWIAFTVSFAFPKFAYVLNVASDPFGWEWDLFGTANSAWYSGSAWILPTLQVGVLLVGLTWSTNLSMRLTGSERAQPNRRRLSLTVISFMLLYTLAMIWLLVG